MKSQNLSQLPSQKDQSYQKTEELQQTKIVNKNTENLEENKITDIPKKNSHNHNQQKFYKLVNEGPEDWKFVTNTLKPVLDKGKVDLNVVLSCIRVFIKRFDHGTAEDLGSLKDYFSSLNKSKKSELELHVFPTIFKLILETPKLFPDRISCMEQRKGQKLKLSKQQCACLLAHMFMCTTIQQENNNLLHPNFNFAGIFSKGMFGSGVELQKIYCLMNYFTRVSKRIRPTFLVFERLVVNENHGDCTLDGWITCSDPLRAFQVRPKGKIEDAKDAVEVDFANKYLGGGVLSGGAVQEEIMFTTSPELIVGMLFFEVMEKEEAILMKGAEVYCKYTGYGDAFCFKSDYTDTSTSVKDNILTRDIIAIDAIDFNEYEAPDQFSKEGILRELNKAYIGFVGGGNKQDSSTNKPISTGKWGCGVFGGNVQLKFILQWLACSRAHRDMWFYSFGDSKNLKNTEEIWKNYRNKTVGDLVKDLLQGKL